MPGVLAGALALRDAGPAAERVDVGYFVTGRGRLLSRGTLHSLVGIAFEPGHAFRRGGLRDEPAGTRRRTFAVDGRPRPGLSVGASEQFALPLLAPQLRAVDVYRGQASGVVRATSGITSLVGRVRTARTAAWILADYATRRVPAAPAAAALAGATGHVVAEAFDAAGAVLARTRLRAPEAYAAHRRAPGLGGRSRRRARRRGGRRARRGGGVRPGRGGKGRGGGRDRRRGVSPD